MTEISAEEAAQEAVGGVGLLFPRMAFDDVQWGETEAAREPQQGMNHREKRPKGKRPFLSGAFHQCTLM